GILLGYYQPEQAVKMEDLGLGFINVVRLFINPIIFLTISSGIVGMGDIKKVGKVGAKALLYFEIITTLALVIGIVVAYIIKPGAGFPGQNTGGDISQFQQGSENFTWSQFFLDNITLQVLVFSLLF